MICQTSGEGAVHCSLSCRSRPLQVLPSRVRLRRPPETTRRSAIMPVRPQLRLQPKSDNTHLHRLLYDDSSCNSLVCSVFDDWETVRGEVLGLGRVYRRRIQAVRPERTHFLDSDVKISINVSCTPDNFWERNKVLRINHPGIAAYLCAVVPIVRT